MDEQQLERVQRGRGFFAALDQSGGSTPNTLAAYGIPESAYSTDDEMFALITEMRSRIALSPAFDGDHILAAILFEDTVRREIAGVPFADYLWGTKHIVPILKVDRGLEPVADGVQLMKPIADLDDLLALGLEKRVFGTKMRSFVQLADPSGITAIVEQQFAVAHQILDTGLVPILEPEVSIDCPEKEAAERLLKSAVMESLSGVGNDERIMIKLTLPEVDDFYADLVDHPKILRVLALSGGYKRDVADAKLAKNHGVIASFSRALMDGLTDGQSDEEFSRTLARSIESIYAASIT